MTQEIPPASPSDDQPAAADENQAKRVSWWARLWRRASAPEDDYLEELNQVIRANPKTAVNYVLRGELFLEMGEYQLAHNNFEQALEITEQEMREADWGIVAQVVQDRALAGLHKVRSRRQRSGE